MLWFLEIIPIVNQPMQDLDMETGTKISEVKWGTKDMRDCIILVTRKGSLNRRSTEPKI